MKEADNELVITYGLRDRRTGEMLRVEHSSEVVNDYGTDRVETTYTLGTDSDFPYFAAASEDDLALVFANAWPGSNKETPNAGGYKPEHLEPVVIEEVVTRRIRAVERPFEVPFRLDTHNRIEIVRSYAKEIDGLGPVLDAYEACKGDLERVRQPGSTHAYGSVYLTGYVVPGMPDDQPEGLWGGLIKGREGAGPCRTLTGLPLPPALDYLLRRSSGGGRPAPTEATLVITLSDRRPLPPSLVEALEDLRPGSGPRP